MDEDEVVTREGGEKRVLKWGKRSTFKRPRVCDKQASDEPGCGRLFGRGRASSKLA